MSINKKHVTQKREPFYEIAKSFIKATDRVLDIGAGNGSFATYCSDKDMYLIDGNRDSFTQYKSIFKNYQYAELPNLPFDDKFFNLIHCSHVVEHLQPETLYHTLKEMDRCLNDNGYIVISAPLLSDFFYSDLSHVKPYNPQVFIKYMVSNKNENLTRSKISNSYVVESLNYRYSKEKLVSGDFNFLIDFCLRALKKLGICKYMRTGFTIVLKKI